MNETEYQQSDLKRRLVIAAREQITREGAANLNLRALARTLGVTHPAVYRYFRNKEALLEAVAEQGFLELADYLIRGQSVKTDKDERLQGIAEAYIDFAVEHSELTRVMFELIPGPTRMRNEHLYAASKRAYAVLQASVADARKDEAVSSAVVWAMLHGLAVLSTGQQLIILTDPEGRKTVVDEAVAVLSKSLF